MASPIAQFRIWDNAKSLSRNLQFDEAVELYRSIEVDMANLQNWRVHKSERDNLFDQTLFFGDYCGALTNAGIYAEAKEKGDLALKFIEQGKFNTLKYIYYNIGNIFLFQKDYEQACRWYETALKGVTYFYTSVNNYLVNYGIALYYLGKIDNAKEKFQLAIEGGKGTKYNKNFEPFFFMMKICELKNDEKGNQNYKKMFLTRLKKYSQKELEFAISTMEDREKEDKEEIVMNYEIVKNKQ